MIDAKFHTEVIENQKAVADKAGKKASQKVIEAIPVRHIVTLALKNELNPSAQLTKALQAVIIKEIDPYVNETLKIGQDFAKVKLAASA